MAVEKPKRKRPKRTPEDQIAQSLIDEVCQRLGENLRVRRTLPEKGRIHIDRQLPFLCVYRQPIDHYDAATERLILGEASYLIAPGGSNFHSSVSKLVKQIVETIAAKFGAFLIVEVWSSPEGGTANDATIPSVSPTFTIHAPLRGLPRTIDALAKRLKRVAVLKQSVEVEIDRGRPCYAPNMKPLLSKSEALDLNCSLIGIAVPPVFRKPDSDVEFPLLVRSLRHGLSIALRQTYYQFVRTKTTQRPRHYHELGRKAVVKAVWDVDSQLAAVSNQFDYLLQLTPVNTNSAWKQFQSEKFEKRPEYHYRPLPIDPAVLKRKLYKIPIERVEDPALQRIFEEKQQELELKLTMLRDRDTPKFLFESLQLFGGAGDDILKMAKDLLGQLPSKEKSVIAPQITAESFARFAENEFEFYRKSCAKFAAKAQVSNEVSGLIVSRGKLLINADLNLSSSRVRALLAHEVGTHLVTYYNGRMQPFQQLYSGLAGYEELQEGLAVLSEYLVGGLSSGRLRQLAARVVAVRMLTDGASFVETFNELDNEYRFTQRAAYNITMRVYRGGGLTKDAVYLKGLQAVLHYVQKGGDLNPLLVGKIAVEHIPIIKELQYRKVIHPAIILPRYLQDAKAIERLEQLRGGTGSVMDLVCQDNSGKGDTG